MDEFMEGDRVIAVHDINEGIGLLDGMTGTVVYVDDEDPDVGLGVEWDSDEVCCHDLGGRCDSERGLWVRRDDVELITTNKLKDIEPTDKCDIESFLLGGTE